MTRSVISWQDMLKVDSIDYVFSKLNNFHKNAQFTVEVEKEGRIPFLDVLMIRDKNNTETTVHCKSTNKNIYFNWTSYAPNKWEKGTPRTLARRTHDICSINEHLQYELSHIKKNFQEQNQYLLWAINEVFCKIKWYNCKKSTNYQLPHHIKKYQIAKHISCFYRIKGKRLIT